MPASGTQSIVVLLATARPGIMPDGDVFGGLVGEVVLYGTGFPADTDREAIATYLMDNDKGG